MANSAVQLFSAFMESQELSVHVLDENENVCYVGFELANTSVCVFIQFSEEGTDASFSGVDFVKIPEDIFNKVYEACGGIH